MALLIRGGQILAGTPAALTRADILVEGDRSADLCASKLRISNA